MLEEHGLPLAVRADHQVVVGEGELDDGMEAGEAAVAGEHLFDNDARMSRAEEVDESVACNGIGTDFGGPLDGIELRGFDSFEDGFRLGEIF